MGTDSKDHWKTWVLNRDLEFFYAIVYKEVGV